MGDPGSMTCFLALALVPVLAFVLVPLLILVVFGLCNFEWGEDTH